MFEHILLQDFQRARCQLEGRVRQMLRMGQIPGHDVAEELLRALDLGLQPYAQGIATGFQDLLRPFTAELGRLRGVVSEDVASALLRAASGSSPRPGTVRPITTQQGYRASWYPGISVTLKDLDGGDIGPFPFGSSFLAFAGYRGPQSQLYAIGEGGAGETQLTAEGNNWYPVLAGNGNGIVAFRSDRDGSTQPYVMNVNGTHQRRLLGDGAGLTQASPLSFSPDAGRVALMAAPAGAPANLFRVYAVNLNGTRLTGLGASGRGGSQPAYSTDITDNVIAFCSYTLGQSGLPDSADIHTVRDFGAQETRATTDPALLNFSPAWAPDGDRLACASSPVGYTAPRRSTP